MRWLRRLLGLEIDTGRRGERLAAKWLMRHGYRILDRNARRRHDEADLIALDPDGLTVVIVEVKTRTAGCSPPETAMTNKKQFRLSRFASRLQQSSEFRDRPLRFDVVAVDLRQGGAPVIRHSPGAFQSPW